MTSKKLITIGFSTHRPETLPFAARHMQQHEAIILEEAATPDFVQMLQGRVSIDDYLRETDFEFAEFSRLSCDLFRRLYQDGKRLFQVDPFMAYLNDIHDLFGNGGKPHDIDPGSDQGRVYAAERRWTASLLAYYEGCLTEPFDEVVELVKHFAREDAARGRFRDRLRAAAITDIIPAFSAVYIEAGTLHLPLLNQLIAMLPAGYRVRPVFLMAPVVRRLCERRQTLGPGDKLTLHYSYRPDYAASRAELLAARSLIHSKIQAKEEMQGTADEFPHTHDEVATTAMVERLSYADCEALYAQVKHATTAEALAIVQHYLDRQAN
jgi:hypothetical protein